MFSGRSRKLCSLENCHGLGTEIVSTTSVSLISAILGVPVERQAVMSMAASTAAAVANGLKRKCVISLLAPAELEPNAPGSPTCDIAGTVAFVCRTSAEWQETVQR
jgi:hypothetical protein